MFNPSFLEKILHKVVVKTMPIFAPLRRKMLRRTDFTIISNNCWGGVCYEYFGLPKQSPTVGTFFFASDYLQFVKDIKQYLTKDIKFIDIKQSKHFDYLQKHNIRCPIGLLDDIEIFFLHYPNEQVAKEKWNRRVKRLKWDNLIFKFSQMNECSLQNLKEFDELDLPGKKLMFVNKPQMGFKCGVYYPGYEQDSTIDNDTFYLNKYLNVIAFLNMEEIF